MTMPKKGSRNIEVNGQKYRWRAKAYEPEYGEIFAKLTVEAPDGRVETKTKFANELFTHPMFTPADVREFILEAF